MPDPAGSFPHAEQVRAELTEVEAELARPELHSDVSRARRMGRRHAELAPVVRALDEYEALSGDLATAQELAGEDVSFAAEAEELTERLAALTDQLTRMLAPRDPHDSADALLEIKSGEGGEESALFAGDLLKMYTRYGERIGWSVQVLDDQPTDLGGHKSVTVAVQAGSGVAPELMPYGVLKFEGGVHRVQRVPVTESQGRIHTSAAGVLVMPDVEADELTINDDDLRIDVFRASGPGGQGVNTTDSAVRITHLPTGTVVSCQNQRSQLQNKDHAMRMLRARLVALAEEEEARSAAEARRSQVRTVDRSERIRTYNFPENRIADHRIGYKAHNLDAVLNGRLDELVAALAEADLHARLEAAGEQSAARVDG
ncbi:peptide chain release factor 1 [Microlunatus sp. Y2014]|uniref:peptide chain release factor 1 n=1 Tax=Microlunatus sp. Y2014 TaxID=3418488 RepID=UPI003DA6DA13